MRTNTKVTRAGLRCLRPGLLCVAAIFVGALGVPGGPTENALAAPPEAPTASIAVGGAASEEPAPGAGASCLMCHEDVVAAFSNTVHGRADMPDWGDGAGCTACHGDAAEHAESGETTDLRVFRDMEPGDANAACLSCHTQHTQHWRGSVHDIQDVRCTDCHNPHDSWADNQTRDHRRITDTCLTCHTNMKKSLFQRSRHPLKEGAMSCVSCHSPHGSPAESAVASIRVNDKCYECHAETRGPFLFEHVPVKEDCSTCHDPHGSNQRDLLVQSAPRLCQSCHLFGHHQTVPGQPTQVWNQNNSCVNCHARIHGSNHPSGVIFLR
jgi:DmsE family decaheme c-type cytochrome